MQELVQLTLVFSRSFSIPCESFSMLDGPGGTDCNVPVRSSTPVPSSIENDAHGIEKLLLKTQVS